MRAHRGSFQLATKISSDAKVGMRIALETGGRLGTSGTVPWLPIRFGLQTEADQICVTDEVVLAAGYRRARHNCNDVLELTVGDRRYQIQAPDTRVPPPPRTVATLSVFAGSTRILGPLSLATATCRSHLPAAPCNSGGPCD